MKILILGATGYLGSKLSRSFIEKGYAVFGTKREKSNVTQFSDVAKYMKWITVDLRDIDVTMDSIGFDWVVNAVCNYGKNNVLHDNVLAANLEFPLQILNLAADKGIKNYLTIGTGLPDDFNMYSFSKKQFGEIGKYYAENHNVNFNNVKLEMFYGYDEPVTRFLPSIINAMLTGKDVNTTVGSQHRDIISINDVIYAIDSIIISSLSGYNEIAVGTGVAPTISEVVDFIWNETGRLVTVNKGAIPVRENEPDCIANTELIASLCDWKPVDWHIGLRKMISEIKNNL